MSTEAPIAANRANAEHSTGPKTEDGKAASSLQRIFFILPHKSTEAYSLLRITLLDEHRPENETEPEASAP
jgi:hypothetical protein